MCWHPLVGAYKDDETTMLSPVNTCKYNISKISMYIIQEKQMKMSQLIPHETQKHLYSHGQSKQQ